MHRIAAPYGSWPSPISAARIAAGARPLAAPALDGEELYWLEGRADEGGRVVLMRERADGTHERVTPPPFNLRSRVHEYGGGAYAVDAGRVVFIDHGDQRVHLQEPGRPSRALTQGVPLRHADFEFDRRRERVLAVQEDHRGAEPRNSLVAIALDGAAAPLELHAGFDFYAAPRLAPDGRRLAWLCWNHPQMPWTGSELWVAALDAEGRPADPRRVAGGADEALCQPRWSADGGLYVLSDRSGWWNLFRVAAAAAGGLEPVCPLAEDCGEPMWVFGQSMWDFVGPGQVVLASIDAGTARLRRIALPVAGAAPAPPGPPLALPFTEIHDVHADAGRIVLIAGSPTEAPALWILGADGGSARRGVRSVDDPPAAEWISLPEAIRYPSGAEGRTAHAYFYPPCHPTHAGPAGERPPLVVTSHGGPTSMSPPVLRLAVQFWTSRGIAVLDVNYGGSSGYGRAYRRLLDGRWGEVDVEDCVAGARFLVAAGRVDPKRLAIRGSSASGFTALAALAFHDVFGAATSLYGVADLAALDADTHKFEAHYTEQLVCARAERERVYAERSPAAHLDRIRAPVLFVQGSDDRVVPPAQSRTMAGELARRGVRVAYLEFEGEGHGLRRPESIASALEAELAFYAAVFGFTPADRVEPPPRVA